MNELPVVVLLDPLRPHVFPLKALPFLSGAIDIDPGRSRLGTRRIAGHDTRRGGDCDDGHRRAEDRGRCLPLG